MYLVAIANGEVAATKQNVNGDDLVREVRAIMWRIPECSRVSVHNEFRGGFTINRDDICLCDTDAYPCECGMAGQ